jgi:hypothetical protein
MNIKGKEEYQELRGKNSRNQEMCKNTCLKI